MKRRKFILTSSGALAGSLLFNPFLSLGNNPLISKRPVLKDRKFTSKAVEELIQKVKSQIADQELAWMFENCFPNTIDTTVETGIRDGKPDTFVITGDIHAMWLRDSTAQVWPYLPLIITDPGLKEMINGLIRRQTSCVLLDPYANAFNKDASAISEWNTDEPKMKSGLHERKWEVDSLCYVVRLANEYHKLTGDASVFDKNWDSAMRLIVATFRTEQRKDGTSPYWFRRRTTVMIDAPVDDGKGRPIKPIGLIASMFRPSDDATLYPFLIPSNLFAILSLRQLAEIYKGIFGDEDFSQECSVFADELENSVKKYAIQNHLTYGEIYAYEIDGFGNKLFMDDANVPSLLSLAYLGYHHSEDTIYQNTRRFVLGTDNPYYLIGKAAEGQSSPHTGRNNIWPMGIILRAITSVDDQEIIACLKMLKSSHAGTGFIHESFDKDNPEKFSRSWFAWANTLFGELIIKLYHERPYLLKFGF